MFQCVRLLMTVWHLPMCLTTEHAPEVNQIQRNHRTSSLICPETSAHRLKHHQSRSTLAVIESAIAKRLFTGYMRFPVLVCFLYSSHQCFAQCRLTGTILPTSLQ